MIPENSFPEEPVHSKNFFEQHQKTLLLVGGLIILIVAGAYLFTRFFHHSSKMSSSEDTSQEMFEGTLLLSVPTQWTTPGGEQVIGYITYEPSTGSVSQLMTPELSKKVMLLPSGAPFAADFSSLLGFFNTENAEWKFSQVSLNLQQKIADIWTPSSEEVISWPLWSLDKKQIAYALSRSLSQLPPTAPDGGTWLEQTEQGATVLREGLVLPEAFQPQAYVSKADGNERVSLGQGQPMAFSPDGSQVLLNTADGTLSMMPSSGGDRRAVTGLSDDDNAPSQFVRFSPSGSYAARVADGQVYLYAIDWDAGRITRITSVSGDWAVFDNQDRLMTRSDSTLSIYVPLEGSFTERSTYTDISLPPGIIIGWRT